jgi:hypothetical protein
MARAPREVPIGARFSHVYLERGAPVEDSQRVRRRVAALIDTIRDLEGFAGTVPGELGVDIIWSGMGPDWAHTLNRFSIRDFLDLVTVASRYLASKRRTGMFDTRAADLWIGTVRRIFEEENFGYTVDDAGGVHYRLDEDFARNRSATIGALQAPRYANVLDGFERGMAALAGAPPDGKGATRAVFAAVEGLFRQMVQNAPRLGAAELDGLMPILNRLYAADVTALRSSIKMLNSLKDWADAAHFYRHEQGVEAVAQPPSNLAVYLVSSGASHLRWLAELDAQIQAA